MTSPARVEPVETELVETELRDLRDEIDDVDAELVALLGRRFYLTRQIGELKADLGLPSLDAAREAEQDARLVELAIDAGIDRALVLQVFAEVRAQARREHDAM